MTPSARLRIVTRSSRSVAGAAHDLAAGADMDVGLAVELVDQVSATSTRPGSRRGSGSSPCWRSRRRRPPPAPPSFRRRRESPRGPASPGPPCARRRRTRRYRRTCRGHRPAARGRRRPRQDHRARSERAAVVERHGVALVGRHDCLDAARDDDLGAEPHCLLARPCSEIVARDAARKAEVVLDARRRAGLAARRLALDQQRAQALRGAVHRRGEARRATADDHEVVGVALGLDLQADRRRRAPTAWGS